MNKGKTLYRITYYTPDWKQTDLTGVWFSGSIRQLLKQELRKLKAKKLKEWEQMRHKIKGLEEPHCGYLVFKNTGYFTCNGQKLAILYCEPLCSPSEE